MRLTANQRLALFKACVCNYMHAKAPHGLLGKERLPPELSKASYTGGPRQIRDPHGTYKTLERLGLTEWHGYTVATPEGMAVMRKLLKLETNTGTKA